MADRPGNYGGQGFALRGEKNRFALPPAFRNTITARSDERIMCVAKHDRWNCLTGFDLARTQEFEALLDREEERAIRTGADFDRDLRSMQLFAYTEVPFDASGRFILPDFLADLGNLRDAIYLQGAGTFFTLWNPEELARMGAGWEGAQAICRELQAKAASAKGRKK